MHLIPPHARSSRRAPLTLLLLTAAILVASLAYSTELLPNGGFEWAEHPAPEWVAHVQAQTPLPGIQNGPGRTGAPTAARTLSELQRRSA